MGRFTFLAVFLSVFLICVGNPTAGSFTSCLEINDHFYHQVIDPDILEIGNDRYFALVIVDCEGVSRPNAFSTCPVGCGLFPDSAVKIAQGKDRVCEGDYIFVCSDQCKIVKFKKESY
jgi:hypothetical protein